jgi:PAS domain S-box-containing protein
MAITSATQLTGGAASDDFAQVLLDMSLTGVILFRPLYAAPGGPISDLAYEYLNPAAQQMLRLPERPTDTFLTLYPAAQQTGVFAFYAAAFASGQTERYQVNYQHDNLDGYFHLVARRHGELLVVSFTDTNDQPRSAVEEALRQSQAREQQALAEAERQRAELQRVFAQSPVAMGLLRGPDLLIEMANARMGQLWGRPVEQLLGRPHFEALPDLAGQGFEQVLAAVLATGQPHEQPEQPITIVQPQQTYYKYLDITYLPERDAQGQPTGILVYATDVTEQVLARRQVQDLNQTLAATNEELAVTNEELTASNEEYLHVNTTLSETQLLLRQLNADLESRVQQRTQELRASHHATAALQAELLATARRQVQEREDLYQVFAQSQAVVLLLRGPDHRIEYLNAAAERLFPGRQLRGRPLAESQPESAVQGFVALLDWVYQTGEPYLGVEVPLTVVGETGQPLTTYFNFTYQDYREQGQVVGVSVFAYDVTQQVLARQQREVQQRQLAEIFAQAPVAICLFQGEDYVLDTVNPPMGEMLGRPLADLLGRPFFVAMPELVSQGLPLLLDQVRRTGTPYVAQEQAIHLGRHAAGQVGYFDFVYQPLRDEQARITAIICVATEVTEQVLARQQVQDLNEELAAINEELMATNEELHDSNARLTRTNSDLSTFVYTASHDLKAPITNIEGLVLALRDTLPAAVQQDEMVAHLLGLLDATAHRFVTTITQLTDLSRLQRAYEEPAELLALAPVVAGVLADLAPVIAEAQATVQVQVPAELHVSFTPAGLRSIVYNLLSNAVKYRAPQRPAQVWLQAEWQPGSIVFTVRDNGLGLTDSQQQRLFQVFQRLHTHVEGSGVGLYMIKRLIENAGASIAVTSTVGVGTTFTVTFPA